MGYGFGTFFELLFGDYSQAVEKAVDIEALVGKKLGIGFKEGGRAMSSSTQNFAIFDSVYAGTECVIEKVPAGNSLYNPVLAGCATGAVLASQPNTSIPAKDCGIQMAAGCATIAAFSTVFPLHLSTFLIVVWLHPNSASFLVL